MVVATVLALVAALLHAGWNLAAKRSDDPFLALWGQFAAAGVLGAVGLLVTGGLPAEAWRWAAVSGLVHVPYVVGLARAYAVGDFSLAYPLARGGGALLAAIGGIVWLGDDLRPAAVVAIVVVAAGMALLAAGAGRVEVAYAVLVAVTIGVYTLADSRGVRAVDDARYALAPFVTTAITVSLAGVIGGHGPRFIAAVRRAGPRYAATGAMSVVAYGLVMIAVRRAPVGYVAALRESSVLVAAVVGWRYLGEGAARRRLAAAAVIVVGLVLLVATG